MKIVAKVEFNYDAIERMVRTELNREGYELEGDITVTNDGIIRAEVRALSVEEKEAAKKGTRTMEEVVVERLSQEFGMFSDWLVGFFSEWMLGTDANDAGNMSPPLSTQGIVAVTPDDYVVEAPRQSRHQEPVDEDMLRSQERISRIRREQGLEPELYPNRDRDADGFVTYER